jgi:hypothetical protein
MVGELRIINNLVLKRKLTKEIMELKSNTTSIS